MYKIQTKIIKHHWFIIVSVAFKTTISLIKHSSGDFMTQEINDQS